MPSISAIGTKRTAGEDGSSASKRTKIDETVDKNISIQTNATAIEENVIASSAPTQVDQTEGSSSECSSKTSQSESSSKLPKRLINSIIEHGEEMSADNLPQSK